ncbi:hypothetical protein BOTBODRAFT_186724 [Botryobasidium botryosum FD-172 SS1]|uniref:F-box domain-containing protein n=1 Tax=Botryobasidium botryosum (strain FD-172 SS1) TaxID=930990 RepID=A0A067MKC6_BOTB1|nr:hypothetical protein BOTBODRAFT_186724 [Botryobasidium botryosum FD-172 SS1]
MPDYPSIQTRVPLDILLEVFGTSRVSDETDLSRLAHVCQTWRRVIHEHPAFWSTIPLDLGKRNPEAKATFWLDRAGNKSLSIRIEDLSLSRYRSNEEDTPLNETSLVRLGLVLRGSMDRWTSFMIDAPLSKAAIILRLCSGFTPKLSKVDITLDVDDSHVGPLHLPFFLPPDRESTGIAVSIIGCVPKFWSLGPSITDLSFNCRGAYLQHALEPLHACPNLVRFTLDVDDPDREHPPPRWTTRSVQLQHLLELKLLFLNHSSRLLDALEVPSLQHLSVEYFRWDEDVSDALWSFFQRCGDLADILITDNQWELEVATEPGFHGAPITLDSVTRLTIHGNRNAASLLRVLSFPNLEDLEIQNIPFDIVRDYVSLPIELEKIYLFDITDIPDTHTPTLLLPALTTLHIRDSLDILNFLITPCLQSLTLWGDYEIGNRRRLSTSPRQFIEREQPALRALGFIYWDVSDGEIAWYLENVPSLKRFRLDDCPVSDATLRALLPPVSNFGDAEHGANINARTDASCLLPKLTSITLIRNSHITPLGVIEFLKSRNNVSSSPHPTGAIARSPPRVKAEIAFSTQTECKLTWAEYNVIQFPLDIAIVSGIEGCKSFDANVLGTRLRSSASSAASFAFCPSPFSALTNLSRSPLFYSISSFSFSSFTSTSSSACSSA